MTRAERLRTALGSLSPRGQAAALGMELDRLRAQLGGLESRHVAALGTGYISLAEFQVFNENNVTELLKPDEFEIFQTAYDVTPGGNWEGHTILNRSQSPMMDPVTEGKLKASRDKLLARRAGRIRPGWDDKVLADWNGLMIAALANAGALLGDGGWIATARRAFTFIAAEMTRGDRLGHSWRAERLLFPGLASDFSNMIRAALALYEATAERGYLDQAIAWQGALDRHYANPDNGGYFLTADDAEGLVVRPGATSDDATPNPNGIAAQNLVRLAAFTGDHAWREKADRLIEGVLGAAGDHLIGHASVLNALDLRLRATEIVVTGSGERAHALADAALRLPLSTRIVLRAPNADALPASHPARDKIAAAPEGAAFVCVGERCSLPVTEGDRLTELAQAMGATS